MFLNEADHDNCVNSKQTCLIILEISKENDDFNGIQIAL